MVLCGTCRWLWQARHVKRLMNKSIHGVNWIYHNSIHCRLSLMLSLPMNFHAAVERWDKLSRDYLWMRQNFCDSYRSFSSQTFVNYIWCIKGQVLWRSITVTVLGPRCSSKTKIWGASKIHPKLKDICQMFQLSITREEIKSDIVEITCQWHRRESDIGKIVETSLQLWVTRAT